MAAPDPHSDHAEPPSFDGDSLGEAAMVVSVIPQNLEGWTVPAIEGLLRQGVFESDRFDFKEQLPHANAERDKLRLVKTSAAFANSHGGFLVFGVKDGSGLAPAQRLVGLDPTEDFPERFGNFPALVQPSVEWSFRNPPLRLPDGRVVHIVHIPLSSRRPHAVPDEGRWWFCKRTSKGTEAMSFQEVGGLFLDASRRRTELAWVRAEVSRIRELANLLNIQSSSGGWDGDMILSRFDVGQLKTLLVSVFGFIGNDDTLVSELHGLIERCAKVDAVLAPIAAFAMTPKDRSYSRSGGDPLTTIRDHLRQIVMAADRVVPKLSTLIS